MKFSEEQKKLCLREIISMCNELMGIEAFALLIFQYVKKNLDVDSKEVPSLVREAFEMIGYDFSSMEEDQKKLLEEITAEEIIYSLRPDVRIEE